jgi:hypothetical protein
MLTKKLKGSYKGNQNNHITVFFAFDEQMKNVS